MGTSSVVFPLSAFDAVALPHRGAIVLRLRYTGTEGSGQQTERDIAPLALTASGARGLAAQLVQAAAELEASTPIPPSASEH